MLLFLLLVIQICLVFVVFLVVSPVLCSIQLIVKLGERRRKNVPAGRRECQKICQEFARECERCAEESERSEKKSKDAGRSPEDMFKEMQEMSENMSKEM